jgi:predicted RNase H-like HicB family nuclease
MRYAVIYEKTDAGGYSAYIPDLPGCIATGKNLEETKVRVADAIQFHLEGLRLHGQPVPQPVSLADHVDVDTAA